MTTSAESIAQSQAPAPSPSQEGAPPRGRVKKLSHMHVPVLDGIRGMAIFVVMIRHFFMTMEGNLKHGAGALAGEKFDWLAFNIARFGSSGVTLFFVLSGYLITGILIDTKEEKNFFKRFYIRRTVRIFPLYYACLALVFWVLPHLNLPPNHHVGDAGEHQVWYWTYTVNIWMAWDAIQITQAGGTTGLYKGLFSFWSLAVEEQFYMVWPFLVYFLSIKGLKRACIFCIVMAVVLRFVFLGLGYPQVAAYVLTPTRIDALAIGAWLAIVAREPEGFKPYLKWAKWALLASAIIAVGSLMGQFGEGRTAFINAMLETPVSIVFGVALLWAVALPATNIVPRLFTWSFLRFLGKYAYCLYVAHTLILGITDGYMEKYGITDTTFIPAVYGSVMPGRLLYSLFNFVITVAVALISWNLLEKPFLKLKRFAE